VNTVSFLSIPAGIVPDQEAVVCEGARFSYADTWTRVRRLAGALAARGVGPGTRVAALHVNSHRYVEAYYATAMLGGVFIPLNYRAKLPELEHMLWGMLREPPSYSGMPDETIEQHEEGWSDLWEKPDELWSFVAERDGRVVGAIVMYRRPTGDLRVPAENVDLAFAATWEDVRGSGAGLALTQHVLGWARERGFRSVTTDWREVNLPASRFWPRRGFRPQYFRLYRAVP